MKLLATIVVPPHLSASGAVNAGLALSRAVAERCDVDVALMAASAGEEQLGRATLLRRRASTPLQAITGRLPNRFRTLFYRSDLPELVGRGPYDLVHIHNPVPTLEMRRIARACRRHHIPYVVSTHGFVEVISAARAYRLRPHERIALHLLMQAPLREVVDHAARIFALSPEEHPLLQGLGVPPEKVSIVTNGVNPFYYGEPTEAELAAVRHAFDLPVPAPGGPLVAMFLGNHTQNKGIDVLLEAMLATQVPYVLIVAGKRRDTIDYAGYAARCRPGQRIIFTDSVSDSQVRALFHCSELFVFPSLADTLPLVVLEAMAAGLPVLATTVGGIPYEVDSSCGRLVPPGDPQALRSALEGLAASRELLKAMGVAARRRVFEQFNWNRSADEAYRQYKSVLASA
jgi:starch synthase